MAQISYSGMLGTGKAGFADGITDLTVAEVDGEPMLFATSGHAAGLSTYSIAGDGRTSLADQSVHASGTDAFADADLVVVSAHGETRAMTVLTGAAGLEEFTVDRTGGLDSTGQWSALSGEQIADALSVASAGALLFIGKRETGVSVFKLERDGSVRNLRNAAINLGHFVALEVIEAAEDSYLVGASATGNSLVSWRIGSDGSLAEIGRIGIDSGLGIDAPSALTTVTANGVPYVVVASANSSSLSVLRLHDDGTLSAADHVVDDLGSRFGGASQLTSVEWGGRNFVLAAGADDGISLFLMLDDGRLLLVDSFEDTLDTPLTDVSALAAVSTASGLQIYATGEGQSGIGVFEVDLGQFGSVLTGTGQDDILLGGGQEDVLVSGEGDARLTGGDGADTFVFDYSDGRDVIVDYNPAQDTIDLSLVPMLYSMDQLTVDATARGAFIAYRDMEIEVRSADGGPLDIQDLNIAFGVAHLPSANVVMRRASDVGGITGTEANDRLSGSSGDDQMSGFGGNDLFVMGPGGDTVNGGPGIDTLDFRDVDGRVLVDLGTDVRNSGFTRFFEYGSAAGDIYEEIERVFGSGYADNLRGGNDGDKLHGNGVSDRLYGRAGDDTLDGGPGADALYGNSGADIMTGGDDAGRRDRYIYFNASDSGVGSGNRDVITDFVPGEDRIELSRLDADISTGGKQGFSFIGAGAFSGTAGELRARPVPAEGITLVQADLDGDGRPDFEIELTGLLTLDVSDFLL